MEPLNGTDMVTAGPEMIVIVRCPLDLLYPPIWRSSLHSQQMQEVLVTSFLKHNASIHCCIHVREEDDEW